MLDNRLAGMLDRLQPHITFVANTRPVILQQMGQWATINAIATKAMAPGADPEHLRVIVRTLLGTHQGALMTSLSALDSIDAVAAVAKEAMDHANTLHLEP